MANFWKRNLQGGLSQVFAFLGLLVNNLIIPKLLGFEVFGSVSILLSVPYFAQGLVESALFAYVVRLSRHPRTRYAYLRGVVRIVGYYWGGACLALLVYGVVAQTPLDKLALAVGVLGSMAVYTLLLALHLGEANSSVVLRNSLIYSAGLVLAPLVFCGGLGLAEHGLLFSVLVTHLLCGAWLGFRARETLTVLLGAGRRIAGLRLRRMAWKLFLLSGPRLVFVTFNTLALLVFGLLASPNFVAVYKLGLSACIAAIYSVPLHPSIVQATFYDTNRSSRRLMIVLAIGWMLVATGGLYLVIPEAFRLLFGDQAEGIGAMRGMFLCTPLLYLVWLTPNLLINVVSARRIFGVSVAVSGLFLGAAWLLPRVMPLEAGVLSALMGSLALYAVAMGQAVWSERRPTPAPLSAT